MAIGIGQLAYELPQTRCTVDELRRAGLVRSDADVLREFGFESVDLVDERLDPFDLAVVGIDESVQEAKHGTASIGEGPFQPFR